MSDWWTEDRRGNLMGFGLRRGTKLTHLTKITDEGPGANSIRTVCGGMQAITRIDSGLDLEDQEQCEAWKNREIILLPSMELTRDAVEILRNLCPRCKDGHQKHLAALLEAGAAA